MNDIESLELSLSCPLDGGKTAICNIDAVKRLIAYVKNLEEINQSHKELNGELREEVKKAYNEGYFKGVRDERNSTEDYIKEKIKYYCNALKTPLINRQTIEEYSYAIKTLENFLEEK